MHNPSQAVLRLGTRGSRLARWQADWTAAMLRALGRPVEIVEIATHGDLNQSGPIDSNAEPGVFTKAIQRALLTGEVDLAVHSLKDLPTTPTPGLVLAAVPPREAAGDVLVTAEGRSIDDLPQGARVGTGSRRRRAQLLHLRPDLHVCDLRGNVETRIVKLTTEGLHAIVLAEAGLNRLGLASTKTGGPRIFQIPFDEMLPAPGQGALGIETRLEDSGARTAVAALDDPLSHAAVTAERAALATLEGGCMAALGALAVIERGQLSLRVVVLSDSGDRRLSMQQAGAVEDAAALGVAVGRDLLGRGAAALLRSR